MNEQAATAGNAAPAVPAKAGQAGVHVQHGEHIDTLESVNMVFVAQRKLSFTYGAVFFAVTLAIPALSIWVPGWYGSTIWGGFTWNYLTVSLLYYLFLWSMAWMYSKQADKLDENLMHMADAIEAKVKGGVAE